MSDTILYKFKPPSLSKPENTVYVVKLNDYTLPIDVQMSITGDKMIAESQILDGVMVYERVTRKPIEIEFNFTVRANSTQNPVSGTKAIFLSQIDQWYFPLNETINLIQSIFIPDKVISVENTLINGLNVFNLIVKDIQIQTIRGSVNVPITLKTKEDYYSVNQVGTTLLI